MNSKILTLSIIGILLSFYGGFYLANSLNGGELLRLQAENEQLKKNRPAETSENTLTEEEIRQRIAEADANPDNMQYQRDLGLALLSYGGMRQNVEIILEAARLLRRVHEKDAQDFDVTVSLGNAFYDVGSLRRDPQSFKKAQEFYDRALAQKPDNAGLRADFGSTFGYLDPPDFARADQELQKALAAEPKKPRILLLMTQLRLKQNRTAEAEQFYARLKEVSPQVPAFEALKAETVRDSQTGQ